MGGSKTGTSERNEEAVVATECRQRSLDEGRGDGQETRGEGPEQFSESNCWTHENP